MESFILITAVVAVFAIIVIFSAISKLLLIAQPNEVIVLSGRKRRLPTGEVVGYRVISGGRAIKMPLIEKASRISLETIPIELQIKNAYSKGGIPLIVYAIANIKIDSSEPAFGNAVERFLTMSPEHIHKIAKDTLEGNLRGVLATLTPEEVNEDRLKFAQSLIEEAHNDIQQLGLKLDTLKITNISDEAGYLDSIGRQKTADVISRARKAEADKKAEAEEAEALALERAEKAKAKAKQEIETAQILTEQNIMIANANKRGETESADALSLERAEKAKALAKQEIETAQILAQQRIAIANSMREAEVNAANAEALERSEKAKAKAKQEIETAQILTEQNVQIFNAKAQTQIETERNALRIKKAELEKDAVIKEKEAEIAGEKAKVIFEQEVQQERIELQKKQLVADVIEPAKAKKEAMELEARGTAASIIANGEAQIQILKQMMDVYLQSNGEGEKVFVLSNLPKIIEQITSTVNRLQIDKLSIIDTGSGSGKGGVDNLISQVPGAVFSIGEIIENATGINIFENFKKKKDDKMD